MPLKFDLKKLELGKLNPGLNREQLIALGVTALLPAPAGAQAISNGAFGALASIAPSDFHPADATDSIAPMPLQSAGSTTGTTSEAPARLTTSSLRAVVQVSDNRVLTFNYNALINAASTTEASGITLRPGGIVIPSASTGSGVIVSLVQN